MTKLTKDEELIRMRDILQSYCRLPFSGDNVPGDVLECILAEVRGGRRLGRYDFIDVIKEEEGIGWQVKSTAEKTPVTWMRAKIPNRNTMIAASERSSHGRRELGKAIIDLSNAKITRDFDKYKKIDRIVYARLIIHEDKSVTYFERPLVTRESQRLFDPDHFEWNWTEERTGGKKEQLSAFHGIHVLTKQKWWAWHGRGENQLHFSGEQNWWKSEDNVARFNFSLSEPKLTVEEFLKIMKR